MVAVKRLMAGAALVVALVPMNALAVDQSEDHLLAELSNAVAQKELAVEESAEIQTMGRLSAENERMMAQLDSEAARLRQLDLVANANAIEDISKALATSFRDLGNENARNELIIAQGRAAILMAKAEADMANALAQGRQTEIDNAKAQGMLFRAAASLISGALAESNMSNAKIRGEMQADFVHTEGLAEAANGQAMGANELLAGDVALAAGEVAAFSADAHADALSNVLVIDADLSLANAHAQLKEAGFDEPER